jgi:D-alanyl-D-alanine carboxypeptidase
MIGTTAFLRPGDKITIRNLLYALMLPSGNDAAWALAEHFGIKLSPSSIKPVRHFVAEMNKRAREMNLILTNFENPHGLMYKKNISCARDVAKMASCGLKDEDFRSIVDTKSYTAEILGQDGVIRFQNWENTNKLLGTGFCGVKTGITDNAGPCLCVAVRKSNPIVIVLLNSRSMEDRWVEAKKLSDWASSRYY